MGGEKKTFLDVLLRKLGEGSRVLPEGESKVGLTEGLKGQDQHRPSKKHRQVGRTHKTRK